jgi:hypothetical protein
LFFRCMPSASTSIAGGLLFRAFGPQHTEVLTKKAPH